MASPLPASLFLALLLGLTVAPGCASTAGSSGAASHASKQDGAEDDAKDEGDERADLEDELTSARHALVVAELELELTRVKAEAEATLGREALEQAVASAAEAQLALATFRELVQPTKVGQAEIDLDRARNRVIDSEAELAELEVMYAEEEFAASTKEIVLSRGRRNLDLARRALDLEEIEFQTLADRELPKQERELERGVEKTSNAMDAARRALEHQELERRLALTKAERAIEEAVDELGETTEELAELEASSDSSQGA